MIWQLAQYDSFLSVYICLLAALPCVILALFGKKSGTLNGIASVFMLSVILGIRTVPMLQFLLFLSGELFLVFFYQAFRKRCKSALIYHLVFFFSMIPILLVRISGAIHFHDSYIGFVGLSYICFKIWQILMEVHDGSLERVSLRYLLEDLLFFPSYSSGPIIRYQDFVKERQTKRLPSVYLKELFVPGIGKIAAGLFYKFALAFLIHRFFLEKLPSDATFFTMLLYAYGYTLYLFFDFAGYSKIAVGFGFLLGIKLPENFDRPFLSRDMKEFWSRWHMSLSTWFNDYVFGRFVLNNVRNGLFRDTKSAARFGYLFSMTAMGLWHGFSVHYLVYGLYEGTLLVLTDVYVRSKWYRSIRKKKWFDPVSRVICFQFIALGMLIFSGHFFEK